MCCDMWRAIRDSYYVANDSDKQRVADVMRQLIGSQLKYCAQCGKEL